MNCLRRRPLRTYEKIGRAKAGHAFLERVRVVFDDTASAVYAAQRASRGETGPHRATRPLPVTSAAGHGPAFNIEMIWLEPLVALLPPKHPLADNQRVSLQRLKSEPWIIGNREQGSRYFDE